MSTGAGPVYDALQRVYDKLPALKCAGLCANSCGPIDMSNAERHRIVDAGYRIPMFTEELAERWANQEPVHCPALNRRTLKCDVYEIRPLICRMWGTSASMRCDYGCEPERVLSEEESMDLLLESMEIGGHHNDLVDGEALKEMMSDSLIGPLMKRLLHGDRSVLPLLEPLVEDYRRNRVH